MGVLGGWGGGGGLQLAFRRGRWKVRLELDRGEVVEPELADRLVSGLGFPRLLGGAAALRKREARSEKREASLPRRQATHTTHSRSLGQAPRKREGPKESDYSLLFSSNLLSMDTA